MTAPEPSSLAGLARAGTLSWIAVSLSALTHVAMGGATPSPAVALAVGLGLTLVGMPWCRRAFDVTRAAPLLLAQQILVHVALTLATPGHDAVVRPTAQLASALGDPHAAHSGPPADLTGSVHVTGAPGMSHSLLPSPGMLLAHVGAALAVAALLANAESGARVLQDLTRAHGQLTTRLRTLLASLASPPLRMLLPRAALRFALQRDAFAVAAHRPVTLTDLWRSPAPCRRGPPAFRAA